MNRERLMGTMRDFGGRSWSTLGDFRKFILRGNVVDLAVGIVIGAAFTGVVNSFVSDFIKPLIGMALSPFGANLNFSQWAFPDPAHNKNPFLLGDFIGVLISFLITAFVIYFFVVRPINALQDRFLPHKEEEKPTTRDCPYCLSTIPEKATRCAFCTSSLIPAEVPATGQTNLPRGQ